MRKFLLLFALIILGMGFVSAQDEIVIGNGNLSGYDAPFNNYYKNSWNETIYKKADIGGACTINSISYHRASVSSSYTASTIKIYMGETTRNYISSNNDWTPSSSLTLVYSGSNVTIGDSEWEKFTLNTPFEYSGENNLVVVVSKTASSYTSSLKWYYTSSSSSNYVSMYRQSDDYASYAQHPNGNSGTQLKYAANIKLGVVFKTEDDENNDPDDYEYVDLGLPSGLKWATCNIGATTPEGYGDRYAWGEITTKDTYTEGNSLTYLKSLNDISGNVQYDAATANRGGNWRIPTSEETQELIDNCTWTWVTQNDVKGFKGVSKTNGRYIFIPAAGYLYNSNLSGVNNIANCWTSTPTDNGSAWGLDYYGTNSSSSCTYDLYNFARPGGLTIRPVCGGNFEGPAAQYASITTNDVSGVLTTSAVCGGNVTSDNGSPVTAKGVCWSTSTNPTINNNKTIDASGVGAFTSNLSNLTPMTTYYVRAYATNAAGTIYGAQKSFTTPGSIEIGETHVVSYGKYSLKFTVTNVNPAQCEVICPSHPSSGTEITIPSSVAIKGVLCSVTSIGDNAFEYCYSYVTSIQIPNSVTSIGDYAFESCSGLTSINIPNGVTSIGDYAFKSCSGLTSINIPNGITSIGDYTFQSCSKLTSIEIPYGVTSIGDYAFDYCGGLTNIIIPNSVTSIGKCAFQDCFNVESIEIPGSVVTIGIYAFAYCSRLKNVEISDGVTTIGNSAFHNCSALTSIEIPNSVTTIGNAVFKYCYSLSSATFSNSVTSIGNSIFYNCNKLTSVELPNIVTSIGDSAFEGCSSLTNIELPNTVTSIGSSAFKGCSSFTDLEIPSSLTSIGSNAFSSCSSLKFIKCYAENVPSAGSSVFESCHSNMAIYVPSASLETYLATEPWSSYNVLPFGSVGDYIEVDYDTHILKYTVTNVEPNKCEVICKTPVSEIAITIPSSVTIEGKEYSVTSIGASAFKSCSLLTSIEIPNGVTSIGNYAFQSCSSLTSIEIPNSVTSIGASAFYGCSSLTNIEIPNSVTSIDYYNAFRGCSSLTSIEIPNGVTSIGSYAFFGCSSLTSIEIPNGVTSIGSYTFWGCSSLTSINIPNGVTSIGDYTFSSCSSLKNIYLYNTIPATIGYDTFDNYPSRPNIYVPSISVDSYKKAQYWSSTYAYITGMPTYTSDGWIDANGDAVTVPETLDHVAINAPMVLSGNTRTNNVLTVNSLGLTENGSLTIEDGAQLIANKVVGEVTVEKNISGYQQSESKWYTIASPLKGVTSTGSVTGLITPNSDYDLYRYDEPTFTWENYKYEQNDFTTLESGRGYLYANAEDVTLEFTGAVNTEDVTYSLTADGPELTGFHLIGNPFTHNITFNHLSADVSLADGYYVLDGEGAWGAVLGNNTEDVIKVGQAALIKTTADGALKISKSQSRSEAESQSRSQQSTANSQQLLNITVSNANYSDKAFVVFDKGVGLDKINHENENIPLLYIPQDGTNYAIAMMDENVNEIPVNFEAKTMGQYTISLRQENCEFEELYLLDKETGNKVNILEESYTFMAKSNDNPERFVLLKANSQQQTANSDFAYISGSDLIINAEGAVQIIDMMGRVVYSIDVTSDNSRINVSGFDNAAYIIRVVNEEGVKVQKIMVY